MSEILFKPSVIPTNDSSIDPKVAFPTFNDHYVNGFVPLISEKLAKKLRVQTNDNKTWR